MRNRPVAALAVLSLLVAACSGGDTSTGSSTSSVASTTTQAGEDSQADTTEVDEGDSDDVVAEEEATATTTLPEVPSTAPLPDGERPAPPTTPGPFLVGRETVSLLDEDRNFRPLLTDIWYPVDPGTEAPPSEYSFLTGISVPSALALDGGEPSDQGPFPVVVYSHGSSGLSYIASFFVEILASHGFVVVAPNHTGNTALDAVVGSTAPASANVVNRPLDIRFVLDELIDGSSVPDEIRAVVDADRIGVVGHSFGGYTALAAAAGLPPEGLSELDTGELDVPADGRIDAIVAMAPVSTPLLGRLGLITIPTMVLTGTDDATTPIEPESAQVFEDVRSGFAYRVDLVDAGHQSVTDVCLYQEVLPTIEGVPDDLIDFVAGFAEDGCAEGQMDFRRAHELTNRYAISFLLAHVAGDSQYRLLLTDEAASAGPDVLVQTR